MFGYKTAIKILSLFILAVPLLWIVLDKSGQRWADVSLLRLLGNPPIHLDFAALKGKESVDEIRKIYPELKLDCDADGQTGLNLNCHAQIAAINGLPARYISFFLRDSHLHMIKVSYRPAYHGMLLEQLSKVYGEPEADGTGLEGQVLIWQAGPGRVVMKALLDKTAESQLFWLAPGYERL
ncbi:MAG: hypothetical protein KJ558_00415 [Gammaproteobacteria bacterium]|nr:hypothetical protein [Gammaproteobacteria bacterium]MBU1653306.1 hypothetical protein [Gammaproteobacteria bacterium]MBU1962446.1 hypothetical protein [Gammaproteobacteria bacterium]